MWPKLYDLDGPAGNYDVNTYGLLIVLAFSAAFLLVHIRALRVGINPDRLIGAYVAAAFGGLLGGRVGFALTVDAARTFSDPFSLFSCAGFMLYGGIAGGVIAVAAYALAARIDPWKLADLAGPAILIGIAVGRLGCFFAGCCHGAEAPLGSNPTALLPETFPGQMWISDRFPFLALEFEQGVGRLLHVPLYPTQLWHSFGCFVLVGILWWFWDRRSFDGQIAALTLILEPPLRMFTEAFRADERGYFVSWPVSPELAAKLPPGLTQAGEHLGGTVAGITMSQGIGVLMILAGVAMYVARRRAGVSAEAPVRAGRGDLLDELV
jgi:phosphatidylglycerol:prolipoprotein diacylglycerol transferase